MRRLILNTICVVLLLGSLVGCVTVISDIASRDARVSLFDVLFAVIFVTAGSSAIYVLGRKTRRGINLLLFEISLIATGCLTWMMREMNYSTSALLVVLEASATLLILLFANIGLRKVFLPLVERRCNSRVDKIE